mmetsp:Transcript_35253/g.82230  ORF Transcript_35253/g.82230 Transcript_35253/m.82230 type:complete len:344 (-) Transcript_35253:479-1510(-)
MRCREDQSRGLVGNFVLSHERKRHRAVVRNCERQQLADHLNRVSLGLAEEPKAWIVLSRSLDQWTCQTFKNLQSIDAIQLLLSDLPVPTHHKLKHISHLTLDPVVWIPKQHANQDVKELPPWLRPKGLPMHEHLQVVLRDKRALYKNLHGHVVRQGCLGSTGCVLLRRQERDQHLEHALRQHPLVELLPLNWLHRFGQPAGILQEEQTLHFLLPQPIEELLHQRLTPFQVMQQNGVVGDHHVRQRSKCCVIQNAWQHGVFQVLHPVVQVDQLKHLSILECQDLFEANGHLQHLPVTDALFFRYALIILEHAHHVLVQVLPQVALGRFCIRQQKDAFDNAPEHN